MQGNIMPPSPQQSLTQQAARQLLHSLDPVQWAVDVLKWTPDAWQAVLLRSTARQVCCLATRQGGKTTTIGCLVAHTALFQPKSLTLIASRGERQAAEMLRKVKSFLFAAGVRLSSDAITQIELPNGSRVVSLPASPDAVRGWSGPTLIVEDESAYIPDEMHLVLRPMMAAAPNCRMILISTPATTSGHFYDAAHSDHYEQHVVRATDIPHRISPDFLAQEREMHGDAYTEREYMASWVTGAWQFFGMDEIRAAFDCQEEPIALRLFT
jgi:hypothetical protein